MLARLYFIYLLKFLLSQTFSNLFFRNVFDEIKIFVEKNCGNCGYCVRNCVWKLRFFIIYNFIAVADCGFYKFGKITQLRIAVFFNFALRAQTAILRRNAILRAFKNPGPHPLSKIKKPRLGRGKIWAQKY